MELRELLPPSPKPPYQPLGAGLIVFLEIAVWKKDDPLVFRNTTNIFCYYGKLVVRCSNTDKTSLKADREAWGGGAMEFS